MRTGVNFRRMAGKPDVSMADITGDLVVKKMSKRLERLALPRTHRDTKETALQRACDECGLSLRQGRRILEGDLADVKGSVVFRILFRFVAYQKEIQLRAEAALNENQVFLDAWTEGSGHEGAAHSEDSSGLGEGLAGDRDRLAE